MIARLLVSFGVAIAAVGFTVYGMSTTYIRHDDDMARTSYVLMAAGIIATVVGIVWYRTDEHRAEAAIHSRERQSSRR